jgi:hypothetical protein
MRDEPDCDKSSQAAPMIRAPRDNIAGYCVGLGSDDFVTGRANFHEMANPTARYFLGGRNGHWGI